jgi:hypothetical protein
MRIFQSILIFSFFLFAYNQCNAGILKTIPLEICDSSTCSGKSDIDDSFGSVNMYRFFQRTEQADYDLSARKVLSEKLFFKFEKIKDDPVRIIPSIFYCVPIGITLIFPKHYFF